jgi:small conductance mechanosensitive channel
MEMDTSTIPELSKYLYELMLSYGLRLVGSLIFLIFGLWVIGKMTKGVRRIMETRNVDPSLRSFIGSLVGILFKVLLVITIMSMIGIQMTSFIAILGAAGLAVGLALQGTLQNFAGGVIILLLKPFKVGDFIEAQGFTGKVAEIQIFSTMLTSIDNKMIIIPNGGLATSSLTNYSRMDTRRVDRVFGIAYGNDFDKAKGIIYSLIESDTRILSDPEPFIAILELADSSVNVAVRVWVNTPDYWDVYFSLNEQIYKSFTNNSITIPFPQMDVHLHQTK